MSNTKYQKKLTQVVILSAKALNRGSEVNKQFYEIQVGFGLELTSSHFLKSFADITPVYGFSEFAKLSQPEMDALLYQLGFEHFYQLELSGRVSFENVWRTQSAKHALQLFIAEDNMKWQILHYEEVSGGCIYLVLSNLSPKKKSRFDSRSKFVRKFLIIADAVLSAMFRFVGYKARFRTAIISSENVEEISSRVPKADKTGQNTKMVGKWVILSPRDMTNILFG